MYIYIRIHMYIYRYIDNNWQTDRGSRRRLPDFYPHTGNFQYAPLAQSIQTRHRLCPRLCAGASAVWSYQRLLRAMRNPSHYSALAAAIRTGMNSQKSVVGKMCDAKWSPSWPFRNATWASEVPHRTARSRCVYPCRTPAGSRMCATRSVRDSALGGPEGGRNFASGVGSPPSSYTKSSEPPRCFADCDWGRTCNRSKRLCTQSFKIDQTLLVGAMIIIGRWYA